MSLLNKSSAKVDTVTLKGVSNNTHQFNVYPWGTSFKSIGAVYAVLKKSGDNYIILYIGQAGNLDERFDDHHKQACFDRNGKTHIAVHAESSEFRRLTIERDLIDNYSTSCND